MTAYLKCFILLVFLPGCFGVALAQSPDVKAIDQALAEKRLDVAQEILDRSTKSFIAAGKTNSLLHLIFYAGKVALAKSNATQAIQATERFIGSIKQLSPATNTLKQAYIEAGEFYGSIGQNQLAYNANLQALKYVQMQPAGLGVHVGAIENNLATYAQRLGNLSLSKQHCRKALNALLSNKTPDFEKLYIAYNGMGSMMWYASKIDSALYYFNLALEALAKTARTPLNQYYRPAIVYNNISALYSAGGKTTGAIEAMKTCIEKIKLFLADKEPNIKKATAQTFEYEAIDNLAGIYKELGDLKKAKELLEYSYGQKQQTVDADDPALFISQILLGQLYFAMKDFEKARRYLTNGFTKIGATDGDYLFWQADACNTLALLAEAEHEPGDALIYYEKADSLYQESLQGEYDDIYLEFLRNETQFYAQNGQPAKAIARAQFAYDYVVKAQGHETLPAFYQLLNLAQVNYSLHNYKATADYSKKGLQVVNQIILSSDNLLDSIKTELQKPKAILLKAQADYEMLPGKNVANLTAIQQELNEALLLVERHRTIMNDVADIDRLMAEQTDLLAFVKKITFELYKLTGSPAYIQRLMSLQESAVYNRIRARLDKNDSLHFARLPQHVQATERALRAGITASLQTERPHAERMQNYLAAIDKWNSFRDGLRVNYPRYYKMRYASIFKSLQTVERMVPPQTTVVRYFYIGKQLLAFVADKTHRNIYALNAANVQDKISRLFAPGVSETTTLNILHALYQQLWQPFVKDIRYQKLIIVPDGVLYNLNFELLTPKEINTYAELATQSLLAKHTIAYNYSLFLLDQKNETEIHSNFVGFAPGFSDHTKDAYRAAAKDSLEVDKSYLTLLPQPFTRRLALKIQELLGGSVFLDDQSTESTFKRTAGDHKVIHIGTHAEANNDHPQYSRLIFAKEAIAATGDNSLFIDEIYSCNLSSNLTVLTACETGRPGYEDGEGMISLAHAFNYAGSESILTGLWKIDEQASAILLNKFYENLLNGMAKDEALRQAKLTYLKEADGRMLAPQYWAGLVIMGDTAPIVFDRHVSPWIIVIVAIVILLFAWIFYRRYQAATAIKE